MILVTKYIRGEPVTEKMVICYCTAQISDFLFVNCQNVKEVEGAAGALVAIYKMKKY